jgi:(E)-4-hydroxy-3-methylbut-2-enyl-diphosphate synthase
MTDTTEILPPPPASCLPPVHEPIVRHRTSEVNVGGVWVGGSHTVAVQSMCDTKTDDIDATVAQIHRLEEAECDIVRVAAPDKAGALAIKEIKSQIRLPLVADIHFDYKLALLAIEAGADKIRINPGNIGSRDRLEKVVAACRERNLPIRVGVNMGSLEKDLIERDGYPTAQGLVDSAIRNCQVLEDLDFHNIIVSLKASDPMVMVEAYEKFAAQTDYPLHLGVTEAGPVWSGTIKSAVAFGRLLSAGIGDTIRVSLTGDVVEEVKVGYEILKALGIRQIGPNLIACPTCGRLEVDMMQLINDVEKILKGVRAPIKVAVMGCVVNGPGEAADADVGIFGGRGSYMLTRKGKLLRKVDQSEAMAALKEEIDRLTAEMT